MADLSKIGVGSRLKFEVEIKEEVHRIPAGTDWYYVYINGFPIPSSWIEAAEHIPAPRVFKRGDWVKEADDSGSEGRRGFVNYIGGGGKVFVAWPDCSALCAHDSTDLEPDEAPE